MGTVETESSVSKRRIGVKRKAHEDGSADCRPKARREDFSEQLRERKGDKTTKKGDGVDIGEKLQGKRKRKSEPNEGKPKEGDKEEEAPRYRVFHEGVESIYVDILVSFSKTLKQKISNENYLKVALKEKIDELQTMSESSLFPYSPIFPDYQAFKDKIEALKVIAPNDSKDIDHCFEEFRKPQEHLISLASLIMLDAWKKLKEFERVGDFKSLKEYENLEVWPSGWANPELTEELTSVIRMINYQNDHGLSVDYQAYVWLKEKHGVELRDFHNCVHVVREMYESIPELLKRLTWWAFKTSSTLTLSSKAE